MNHQRILVFRHALADLLESLDATIDVTNGSVPEVAPEPNGDAAAKLQVRLASAGRLAAGKFSGTPADIPRVATICGQITQLESAYVAYCRQARGSKSQAAALRGLTSAMDDVRKTLT